MKRLTEVENELRARVELASTEAEVQIDDLCIVENDEDVDHQYHFSNKVYRVLPRHAALFVQLSKGDAVITLSDAFYSSLNIEILAQRLTRSLLHFGDYNHK